MHVQNRLTIAHRTTDRVALRHDSSSPPPDRKKAPLLQLAVEVYREHVSAEYNATRGSHCGYHESCSCYACKTLQERGVGALPSVMSRLRRCTSENDLYRLSQLLRFTAQCPQDRVSQFFHAQDAQTRQAFLHFRAEVSKGAVQLASGNDASGVGIIESALQAFTRTTHFAIDEPMGGATEPRGFHLIPRRPARPTFMADRGPLGNGLRTLGSLAVAVPSCVIGGAVGAVLGMGVGASEGLAAGLGLNRALEAHANSVGGVGSLNGTTRVRASLEALHHRSHAILGFECLADLIGGPVGVIVGLAGGGLGGLSTGGTVSWKMGRILGRSLSDGALKERFPSRGRIEVAPARIAPSLPSSTLSAPSSTAQQAQKMWNVLTDTPEVFRTAQRPGSAPTWRFALFSDATSADLESAEIRRVIEFERNLPQRASARIHLRRGGLVPSSMQRLTPWAQLAASAAALAAVGGVSGPGLIPVLLTRLTSLGVSLGAVKELVRDRLTEKEGHWTGQRVYALSQPTGGRSDHIESTPLEHHPAVLPSARTRLVHDLTSAFQQEGPRVAIFSGHGRSYQNTAGNDPTTLADALAEVARSSGRKTDLVVLEACFSGTLEALRPFAKGARYALASQLPMSKVGLPWHHILRNIDELGQSPRDLACSIIDLVGGTRTVPSLSLIDLEKLEDLTQELEALALMVSPRTLASALPAGEVGRDAHWGRQLTDRLARFGPGSQSGDLMRVLEELEAHSQNPQEREQIERVRRTLAQTVVSARGDALGGLSVETGSLLFDRTSYVAATGMNAWAEGLAQARPAVLEPIARLTTQVGNGLQRARTFLLRKAYAPPAG